MAEEYYQLNHTGEQIDDAVSKIDDLKNHIETNTANIQTNTTDIDTLKRSVEDKGSQISTNTNNIKNCFGEINDIKDKMIRSLLVQINSNSKKIEVLTGSLGKKVEQSDYESVINGLKSQDNQLQNNIEAAKNSWNTQLNLAKNDIESNSGNIDTLFNRVNNINTSTETLTKNVKDLQNAVDSLSQTYNEFIADDFANTKKTAVNALAAVGQLQTIHQTDIEKIQKNISDLSNTYVTKTKFDELSAIINGKDGIADSITNLDSQIAEFQKQIANLQKQIDDLKGSTP